MRELFRGNLSPFDPTARVKRGENTDGVKMHPIRFQFENPFEQLSRGRYAGGIARVAQLDRALASEAEGCGFDPRRAHHPGPFEEGLPAAAKFSTRSRDTAHGHTRI